MRQTENKRKGRSKKEGSVGQGDKSDDSYYFWSEKAAETDAEAERLEILE